MVVFSLFILNVKLKNRLDIMLMWCGIIFCVQIMIVENVEDSMKLISIVNIVVYNRLVCGSINVNGVMFRIEVQMIGLWLIWLFNGLFRKLLVVDVIRNVNRCSCVCVIGMLKWWIRQKVKQLLMLVMQKYLLKISISRIVSILVMVCGGCFGVIDVVLVGCGVFRCNVYQWLIQVSNVMLIRVVFVNYDVVCWLYGMIIVVVISGFNVVLKLFFIWNIDCVKL